MSIAIVIGPTPPGTGVIYEVLDFEVETKRTFP